MSQNFLRARWVVQVLSLFVELQDHRLSDMISYNAVIAACDRANDWQQALRYLEELKVNGMEPDIIVYFTTLKACGNSERWQEALLLLELFSDSFLLFVILSDVVPGGRNGHLDDTCMNWTKPTNFYCT